MRGTFVEGFSQIVVYDSAGLFSAARVWWMFRLYGHQNVQVLDGGLPAWKDAGYPTTPAPREITKGRFKTTFKSSMIATEADVKTNCETGAEVILDARSAGRFRGVEPEPRPELPSGHMPGAVSLPFTELLQDGKLKHAAELRQILGQVLNPAPDGQDRKVITSCGSGVTAAIITLAMADSGFGLHRLYDGSWTEWASNPDNPIVRE